MRFPFAREIRKFERNTPCALLAAVLLGPIVPCSADTGPEQAANAFLTSKRESKPIERLSMPYTAVVAPAPADTQLDRARFSGESPEETTKNDSSDQPKALAGDDVLAYAGRRATLNGGMSQPAGRIGVRWIQISGPPVREAFAQGPNLVVVPPEPGVYQFLLVVASGGVISEPDTVLLTAVAHPEDEAKRLAALTAPVEPVKPDAPVRDDNAGLTNRELFVKLAKTVVSKVSYRPETLDALAEVFADVSAKMGLYGSYAEAHEELSRRITTAIDGDTADVATWNRQVFEPLTAALSAWVAPTGLDPGNARLWSLPLTEPARSRLADGLKVISEGFRNAGAEPIADRTRGGQRR